MEKGPVELKMVTPIADGTGSLNGFADPARTQYEGTNGDIEETERFLPEGQVNKPGKQFTDHVGKASFGMSVFNLGNAIMGSGILGLAYALANTGIVLFVLLLISVALLSVYSIHLLLKTAGIVGIRAYEQLGYGAFKTPGKVAAGCAITLQNIGAMSSYLYIVKTELPTVIRTLLSTDASAWYLNGDYLVVIVTIGIILPLALMKNIGYLGYTSGFSLMCMVFFLIVVIYKKFQILCPEADLLSSLHNETSALNVTLAQQPQTTLVPSADGADADAKCVAQYVTVNAKTAYTVPILAFAFVCHPEVLPIYTELRNPTRRRMQKVANLSVFTMFVMYLLTAIFGYLTFYETVEDELLHRYKKSDQLILCVRLAVLVAVTLTVPIVHFPVRKAIQEMLFPGKPFSWVRHVLIAVTLLAVIVTLVITVPNIREIFGFIGSTSAPCLIFIFPAIFYIRNVPEDKEPMRSPQKIGAAVFGLLGVAFMVMSLGLLINNWVSPGDGAPVGGH